MRFSYLSDYIVFWFHSVSSRHSRSWTSPLFWIVLTSIATTYFLHGQITLSYSFKYASILLKIDDFNDNYIIMMLNKITLGYLYYQFITAIRKDTRK